MTWPVEVHTGSAADLHARTPPVPWARGAWRLEADGLAVVLGSTQPDAVVDRDRAEAASATVVRRRSGGGAVWVAPGRCLWVDVFLPRGDPLWDDDVGRAAHWLGDAWVRAVRDHGAIARVHRGALVGGDLADIVCFAGIAPGEVLVDGRKLVGVSQRRTRDGARFQCVVHDTWDPGPLVAVLALDERERRAATDTLAAVAVGATELGMGLDDLAEGLWAHLPATMC